MPQLPAQVLKEFRVAVVHFRHRNRDWLNEVNKRLPSHERWNESTATNLESVNKDGRPRKRFELEHLNQLEKAFGDHPRWPEYRAKFLEAMTYQDTLGLSLLKEGDKPDPGEETEAIDEVVETPIIEAGKSQSEKSEAPMTFQTNTEEQDDLPGKERRKLLPLALLGLIVLMGGSCLTGVWLTRTFAPKPTPQAVVVDRVTPSPTGTAEPAKEVSFRRTDTPAPTASNTPTATATETPIPTDTPTRTPTITPTPFPLPFEDAFNAGLSKDWRVVSGTWNWANGRLVPRESGPWSIILTGDPNWTDYAVEVDLGANFRWADALIILRATEESYMAFEITGHNVYKPYGLFKVEHGRFTEIARGGGYLDVEYQGLSYRAEAVGEFYRLYLNDSLVLESQDGSFSAGAVGLAMKDEQEGWFDNFRVTAR